MQPGLQSLLELSSISLAARCRLEQVAFRSNADLNDKDKDKDKDNGKDKDKDNDLA